MISQNTVQEILEKLDIVELVAGYVALRKAGRNFRGLCPFHSEKTPSFFVNPDKQIFHCFGCGTGGNLLQFLMRIEGIDFPEAISVAAEKAGVEISSQRRGERKGVREIYDTNAEASRFFQQQLESSQGSLASELLEQRGIPHREFSRFALGYAPSGNALSGFVEKEKGSLEIFEKAGLFIRKGSSCFDYFRHRIMIPIFDGRGRIAGFGGRSLEENQQPKYLNSVEHPAFKKSSLLYGLHWAKERIRRLDFAILVEGYFDVIKLHLAGFENSVAPMGTYVTDSQMRQLKRFAKRILVVFDADNAGDAASARMVEVALSNGFDVRIASLPRGFDPDGFIDNYGADAFTTFLNTAKDFIEHRVAAAGEAGLSSVRDRASLASDILRLVRFVPDPLEQEMYLNKFSELTDIDPVVLMNHSRRGKEEEEEESFSLQKGEEKETVSSQAERLIMGILLDEPSWWEKIAKRETLLPERLRKGLEVYRIQGSVSPAIMLGTVEDKELATAISSAAMNPREETPDRKEKIFDDCLIMLLQEERKKRIQVLKRAVSEKASQSLPYSEEMAEIEELFRQMKTKEL